MTPARLIDQFRIIEKSAVSLLIEGPPGIGKSQICYQFARESGRTLHEIRPSQWDASDVKGLPNFITRPDGTIETVWTRPGWLPKVEHSILLIEELDKCMQSLQAAMLEVSLDRRIGTHALAADCMTIATANRIEDRSGSFALSKALGNRFQHVKLTPDNKDWETWAIRHGIRIEPLAYLRYMPENLHRFDPTQKSAVFATPRQWEMLDRTMNAMDALKIDPTDTLRQENYSGHIGPEIGAEYHAFCIMYRELPDIRKIDKDPDGVKIPSGTDARFAVTTALSRSADANNVEARIRYIERIADAKGIVLKQYGVLFAQDLTNAKSPALATAAFSKWLMSHQDYLKRD